MNDFENNAYFWQKVDTLYLSGQLQVTRSKGDHHPQYANLVYPTDYGHLVDTNGIHDGVSVYLGSGSHYSITGLIVAVDILKKDLDVKILAGCTEDEVVRILRFLNQTEYQKTVLIRKGTAIPDWATSSNN